VIKTDLFSAYEDRRIHMEMMEMTSKTGGKVAVLS
jgi:hypothetical protein